MNIVLHEPEIPFNTGNIGRTCVATNSSLHLIRPLGFSTDDKAIRRSGLDYWSELNVKYYDNFEHFLNENPNAKMYMVETKAKNSYSSVKYDKNAFIMFGRETTGIPEEILINYKDTSVRIPMAEGHRSLNLSSCVSIVLYEALRQHDFNNLQLEGDLDRLKWD